MNKVFDLLQNLNYIDVVLKGAALAGATIFVSSIIGFLLSIPTDYGRIFLFFMIFFTAFIYVQLLIFYFILKLLAWGKFQILVSLKVNYHTKYRIKNR